MFDQISHPAIIHDRVSGGQLHPALTILISRASPATAPGGSHASTSHRIDAARTPPHYWADPGRQTTPDWTK
jgi:hypothetical protein